jgi:hypothetical protein
VLQVGVGAVGLVEIAARPLESTITHSDVEAHEIASGSTTWTTAAFQGGAAAAGSVEITARLLSSMATHKSVAGHEMPQRSG